MYLTPDSEIKLYSDVEIDNGEQLAFSSVANQLAYFAAHEAVAYAPCTVVRKTGALRVEVPGNTVSNCNYLSFKNPHFDDKIIYARITDYEYVNNECTEITYAIDYWQTWMFDVTYDDCYIEREHLSSEDWDKADQNPYDPEIFEFRTGESLIVSKDLEPLEYEIGSDSSKDGYHIVKAMGHGTDRNCGVLIKFNNIDLEALDQNVTGSPSDYPSKLMHDYLTHILSQPMGYIHITSSMRQYLHDKNAAYPSIYTTDFTNDYMFNQSGWINYNGNVICPFKATSYNPGCCVIYDQYGATESNSDGNGYMGEFLKMMTKYNNVDGIIDMSIIPNAIMLLAGTNFQGDQEFWEADQTTGIDTTPDGYEIVNKKLMRFPYQYLRVLSPNGDVKEYKFEHFQSAIRGDGVIGFDLLLDISDRPVLMVVPKGYKYDSLSYLTGQNTNILEAIYFDQWPTMPYTIDAFTAQVAAVANDTIANRTLDNQYALYAELRTNDMTAEGFKMAKTSANITSEAVSTGMSKGRNLGGLVDSTSSGFLDLRSNVSKADASRWASEAHRDAWMKTQGSMSGNEERDVVAQQLKLTKPAFACDKYVPSNGCGVINFSNLSFFDLVLLKVRLSDDILKLYDNYFTYYGYTSGRCGIPRVCLYTQNNPSILHWMEISNQREITYVKTVDLHVTHSMLPVAEAIREMFNNGIRFIKGD